MIMGLCKVCTVVFVAVLVAFSSVVIPRLGLGRVVWNHQPGECHFLEGIEHGSEDMEVLSDDIVLITSGLKFPQTLGSNIDAAAKGQIFWFDFKYPAKPAVPVKIQGNLDLQSLNPHGMSSWRDEKRGVTFIYVINHAFDKDHDTVEKFTWESKTKVLTHVRSISDPAFRMINDLFAVGEDQLYVTNIIYNRGALMKMFETLTFREWGEVIYYDGRQGKVVGEGLGGPNGVAVSPDGKFLYVTMFISGDLHVYNRLDGESLDLRNVVAIGSSLDNLHVDPKTGDLWIGSHPIAWKIALFIEGGVKDTPSHVLRLKMKDGGLVHMEEIFADDGRHLSGSSVAAYRNGTVLIGTVARKVLLCQVAYLQ